jgi:alkylation response protein AidB-like acyl-CoA dehydrogenase
MTREVLTEEMLTRFSERAPKHDAENTFFAEDFEELRGSGYLKMAIPEDLGGLGYSLADVTKQERRLAYHAPATALATNMHVYWTGVAADLRKMGDPSLEWLLREAAAGEIFAAGHGEVGDGGVLAIGSGANFALAAARALLRHTELGAREIAEEALGIAADICIYTNHQLTVEEL